jgi:hypothetical protein
MTNQTWDVIRGCLGTFRLRSVKHDVLPRLINRWPQPTWSLITRETGRVTDNSKLAEDQIVSQFDDLGCWGAVA